MLGLRAESHTSTGVSWEDVLEPLEHISLVWVFVFLFYIQFTYFAVLLRCDIKAVFGAGACLGMVLSH